MTDVAAADTETRVALIRMAFPGLAVIADQEAAGIAAGRTRLEGAASAVIRVAASKRAFWHGGTDSAAEGLDGGWEDYIRLAIRRIPQLRHLRPKDR